MSPKTWLRIGASAILSLALSTTMAVAQGNGHGHEKHDRDDTGACAASGPRERGHEQTTLAGRDTDHPQRHWRKLPPARDQQRRRDGADERHESACQPSWKAVPPTAWDGLTAAVDVVVGDGDWTTAWPHPAKAKTSDNVMIMPPPPPCEWWRV